LLFTYLSKIMYFQSANGVIEQKKHLDL